MNWIKRIFEKNIRKLISGTFENLILKKEEILKNYTHKERVKDLYVSMTTYEPRVDFFEFTVLSLLGGTLLPEKILIYVPKGFIHLMENNPNSFVKNEIGNGLIEMIEMEIDLGCHSKYYYSFQKFGRNKDIIICDDDVVYYSDWLKDLNNAAKNNSEYDIFAFKAVHVTSMGTEIAPYADWIHCNENELGDDKLLYAEGVGGVFYRRGKLTEEIFNVEKFLEIVPKADDVWLWFCSHYNNLSLKYVTPSRGQKLMYVVPNSQDNALWIENTSGKRNDIYVKDCNLYFKNKLGFDISLKK